MPATVDADPHSPSPAIIPDIRGRAWAARFAAAALVLGALAAWWYAWAGLTLSHYDAKAHLVVARRILDSLTPGWVQIGAVWLPLPHLVSMIPVQWDVFYRTGAFGVALSVVSFAVSVWVIVRLTLGITGSRAAAVAAALVVALNPNVLYLQSTPMTEPMLMALVLLSAWFGIDVFRSGDPAATRRAGASMAAAVLTRYEAWPFAAALLAIGGVSALGQGRSLREAAVLTARLAIYPAAAVLAFLVLSRATVGAWFVTSGFFVAENPAHHRPLRALASVWWGVHELSSLPLALIGAAGLAIFLVRTRRSRVLAAWLPVLALAGVAALPWYAFYSGHPFRIRYMIPLLPVLALGVGCAVGLAGRLKPLAAVLALSAVALGPRPLDPGARMVVEAQWDRKNQAGRAEVAAYLRAHWNGRTIMVSMGSLAHFMQELSRDRLRIRDFLHEGNGGLWRDALESPGAHVEWVLIEEKAEGGDMLAARARSRPGYLADFARVAEGGGVALYRRR
ncbi:MAG: hypothetical protein R6V57_19505 [Vicinamibacterales bacterium]